ncbi:hypothetical protein LPTSP4_29950 [Leptospira ryugenii]|uniref:GWxTD domain-containing protein n=1 Tax=Leptospira ryugenii TaxID=1917863 RepID=A0A2P2E3J3_9LEPT|nr:hypothetical protein [Leptospira ryugenii]GBF51458.1 hypothetical protein LPTSP4_29950 [Leptospira ryugenii]
MRNSYFRFSIASFLFLILLNGQSPAKPTLFNAFGTTSIPKGYVEAVETYLKAEDLIRSANYAAANSLLTEYWRSNPESTSSIPENAGGIFTGHPPAYASLQMITKVANVLSSGIPKERETFRYTILIPDSATGYDPSNLGDAEYNKGKPVSYRISPKIAANQYQVLKESTWLFAEYLSALFEGQVKVIIEIVPLKVSLPIEMQKVAEGAFTSRPEQKAMEILWQKVPNSIKQRTDFWMLVFPSHKPSNQELKKTYYFTGGGMGTAYNGSPLILIDDEFLLRAQPHFGVNEKSFDSLERRLYIPQFLQHEFFHHIYRNYTEFKLEAKGHQWHDRSSWPKDFVGKFESDYYQESFEKRIRRAEPSLLSKLRFQEPSKEVWSSLQSDSMIGQYVREPEENDWHRGTIVEDSSTLYWENEAGVRWRLTDNNEGELIKDEGTPYYEYPLGKSFKLKIKRDNSGKYSDQIDGFYFNGEYYRKIE